MFSELRPRLALVAVAAYGLGAAEAPMRVAFTRWALLFLELFRPVPFAGGSA
jgi:hypothetical protein